MTVLVAASHGFQKWLSSKSSTALLDVWNDTMLGSVASREQYEACCKQLSVLTATRPATLPVGCLAWQSSPSRCRFR